FGSRPARQPGRQPHPDAAHEGNPVQPVDELAEAVLRRIAEADDPGYEPSLLVLSAYPLRRRHGIRGAGVRPHNAAHVELSRLALVVRERVHVGERVVVADQLAHERAVRQPEHGVVPLVPEMNVAVNDGAECRHAAYSCCPSVSRASALDAKNLSHTSLPSSNRNSITPLPHRHAALRTAPAIFSITPAPIRPDRRLPGPPARSRPCPRGRPGAPTRRPRPCRSRP